MSGAGNLFTVLDNSVLNLSKSQVSKLCPILCSVNEYNNFRSEGLILMDKSVESDSDFKVEFFNPDGGNDAMCGNGGRCAVYFANSFYIKDTARRNFRFLMNSNYYDYELNGDNIRLFFDEPKSYNPILNVTIKDIEYSGAFVDVGARHFVLSYDKNIATGVSFDNFDLNAFAPPIRYAKEFGDHGANVNIYKFFDKNKRIFKIRTFERGVEAETGACGTGAISTAYTLNKNHSVKFPITLIPTSGEKLIVDFNVKLNKLILEGGAIILDAKEIDTPDII
jgi:diaminopimelate epimerase